MLSAELKVIGGKRDGHRIPLPAGKFLIGREEDCHLRPGNDLVSRHHCVFSVDEFGVRLRDLGSTNGTFVNDERLKGAIGLSNGDRVRVGKLELELVLKGAEASEEAPAVPEGEPASDAETIAEAISTADTMYAMPAVPNGQQQPGAAAQHGQGQGHEQGQYPQQQMPPGMQGYPPQYLGYPPQYMQGYPYMGYPQMMPGYGMPQMPYPGMQQPQADEPSDDEEELSEEERHIRTRLPDPSSTGAQAPEPSAGGEKKDGGKPPNPAADVIKQYLQRRPTS